MITRRKFVENAGVLAGGVVAASLTGASAFFPPPGAKGATSDRSHFIRLRRVQSFGLRSVFAGAVVDRATMVTVRCSVRMRRKGRQRIRINALNHTSLSIEEDDERNKNDAMKALAPSLRK